MIRTDQTLLKEASTSDIGRRVKLHGTGLNCNLAFDQVTGKIISVSSENLNVLLDKHCYGGGEAINFYLFGDAWSFEFIDEWDV